VSAAAVHPRGFPSLAEQAELTARIANSTDLKERQRLRKAFDEGEELRAIRSRQLQAIEEEQALAEKAEHQAKLAAARDMVKRHEEALNAQIQVLADLWEANLFAEEKLFTLRAQLMNHRADVRALSGNTSQPVPDLQPLDFELSRAHKELRLAGQLQFPTSRVTSEQVEAMTRARSATKARIVASLKVGSR